MICDVGIIPLGIIGSIWLQIRGGDTKFIVPVLVVIGVIILGIILIMALK